MRAAMEYTLPALSFVAFLLAWQAYVQIGGIPPIYLPSPVAILRAAIEMMADGSLWPHLGATLLRIYAGFAIAALLGIACGVAMAMSRLTRAIADPWIAALYPLPKISLIPLLVIWLGTGEMYKIVISAVAAFFPILMSTYAGVRQVDTGLIKAAEDLGASSRQLQLRVVIPAAIPMILAGLQLGIGVTIILVIAAEMIGGTGSPGLGGLLIRAGQVLETEKVFAILIVLAIMGAAIMKTQDWIAARAMPWAD
jgi:NitT/TauT family transport system permease protein